MTEGQYFFRYLLVAVEGMFLIGDGHKSDSEEGQEWRDSKAEKENMNKERRYSGLRDYGALGFAIGFVEHGEWVLLGQSIDIDEESGKWRVLGAREI